ncbi:MAG: TFIIB-type zinc ribbon-containing protein [Thermoleophilia bacterium]
MSKEESENKISHFEEEYTYECGECGVEVDVNDEKCPICGANIEEVEDAFFASEGKFRNSYVRKFAQGTGRYRGKGRLIIADDGMTIEGRHVMSFRTRLLVFILLPLGFIPSYFLVEYVLLVRENISISWESLRGYAFNTKSNLVALDFEGPEQTSPAVFRTQEISRVINLLREKAPDKDNTLQI